MQVRLATTEDMPDWVRLRTALWPHGSAADHRADIEKMLQKRDVAGFVARNVSGAAMGFAEVSVRHEYVNGTGSSPVGFLEGIYVEPDQRRNGVARGLCEAVVQWTRNRGCSELASDTDLKNTDAQAMHEALGFEETERVVYYRMRVD